MVTRAAVLSDVHGVVPALEAVLAEPDVRSADLVVLTGDLAAGPQPVETLDLLAELGDRAAWVRGNADRELVAFAREEVTDIPDRISPWAATQLRPEQVTRLANLPTTVECRIEGLGRTVFCHATPRDDQEVALVDSSTERWQEVLAGLDEDVTTVVCGHTHMPFARLVDRRMVVNPGSVGAPYGGPGAFWALLASGGVMLRRTSFDYDAACARIAAESGYPQAADWADRYVRGRHGDVEALRVFGPLDGRARSDP